MLINETDVFLEHRRSGARAQAGKTGLVAVSLKHLEYFLHHFLTSNQAYVIDAAVASRTHHVLK
jgi:hypothetical protein